VLLHHGQFQHCPQALQTGGGQVRGAHRQVQRGRGDGLQPHWAHPNLNQRLYSGPTLLRKGLPNLQGIGGLRL